MGSVPHLGEDGSLAPLAVVGMSFRFPEDAVTAEGFWRMLVEKRCVSTMTPEDRFNMAAHHHPNQSRVDTLSYRGGHFMDGSVDTFDAPFFSIPVSEAEAMDPLHRMTLEAVFRALEQSGIPIERVSGTKTAVFAGCLAPDYPTMQHKDPLTPSKYQASGTSINMLSNRVSWFFNLLGPSATIDTACSSSLMALDLTCQAIWSGDAEMGLACGSNVIINPESGQWLDNLGMLSKDSRCFSFDHRANGYARGEGVGVLVIKPLEDALRDGDTVRAIIRSTCSNQDGKTQGITQPSKDAQRRLIEDAYAKAGLDMLSTRYFEAHGTGTPVGDPIEAWAIGTAFRRYRSKEQPLFVGSVKSNIGHLEGAAGVAGVIKTILSLEAGMIPPNSNFERLNPKIDGDFLNIKIPESALPWPSKGLRRASVQSFGFGGSNSHVILDDAYNFLLSRGLHGNHNTSPAPGDQSVQDINAMSRAGAANHAAPFPRLLVWSTADEAGSERLKQSWADHYRTLSQDPSGLSAIGGNLAGADKYLASLAYTLSQRRTHFPWRSFMIGSTTHELSKLDSSLVGPLRASTDPKLGLVFSGQGSQWFAMGRDLIDRFRVYRKSLTDAGNFLRTLGCNWDAIDELQKPQSQTNVDDPLYSQTLCTVVQVGLVELLRSFAIRPLATVGHSSGEIGAAFCSGAISREAAWAIAYHRGMCASRLSTSEGKYGMAAVGLSSQETEGYINKVTSELGSRGLVVGCVNSPRSVTVSGVQPQIDRLCNLLEQAHVFAKKLRVGVAYHSFQMHEVSNEYLLRLKEIPSLRDSKQSECCAIISSVTGTWISADEVRQPEYWVRNLVSPVLFSDAVEKICQPSLNQFKQLDGAHRRHIEITDLLEVGPHSTLQGPIRGILDGVRSRRTITYTSMLVRNHSATKTVLEAMGRLHCLGHSPSLAAVNVEKQADRVVLSNLPEYLFDHSRAYWYESRISKGHRFRPGTVNDLLGVIDPDFNPLQAKWRNIIRATNIPWIEDHKINGTILYPAAGMLAMAIEAANQLADPHKKLRAFVVKNTTFHSALQIPPSSATGVEVNIYLQPRKVAEEQDAGWHDFRIYAYENDTWQEKCNGSIQAQYESEMGATGVMLDTRREDKTWLESIRRTYASATNTCSQEVNIDAMYHRLLACGYEYGPAFRAITALAHDGLNSALSEVRTFQPTAEEQPQKHIVHPTTLDCVFQGILFALTAGGTKSMVTAIPTYSEEIWISGRGLSFPEADTVKVYSKARRVGMRETETSIVALDSSEQEVLLEVKAFRATEVAAAGFEEDVAASTADAGPLCHRVEWKEDLDLLSTSQIQRHFSSLDSVPPSTVEPVSFLNDVDFFITACIQRMLKTLDAKDESTLLQKHHKRMYISWARRRMELLEAQTEPKWKQSLDDEALLNRTAERIAATNNQGRFYTAVGTNLLDLVKGNMDPLDFLFRQDLVKEHYFELWETMPAVGRVCKILDALVHKNPNMRILEVGAGTGAMTRQLMKPLTSTLGDDDAGKNSRYRQYDYTDVSSFFLGPAQEVYADQGSRMQFRKLNIEMDPEAQGFDCGTYDIVVAAAVLHATKDLNTALRHCRKLLRPGGKLILWEVTNPEGLRTAFAFGLLEGWWLSSEPYREWGPCLDEDAWGQLLTRTGFSEDHIVLRDYEDDVCHEFSIIVSTAVAEDPETIDQHPDQPIKQSSDVSIFFDEAQRSTAVDIQRFLTEADSGMNVGIYNTSDSYEGTSSQDSVRVFLPEVCRPVWHDLSPEMFVSLKNLLTRPGKNLWVSKSHGTKPDFRLIDGLSRVLNSELGATTLTSLSLEGETGVLKPEQMSHIAQICRLLNVTDDVDTEYVEEHGVMKIPRLVTLQSLNTEVATRQSPRQLVRRKWAGDIPLRLVLGSPGLLNTLQLVEDTQSPDAEGASPLGAHEVEIRVHAVGLNFRDLLIALGRLNETKIGYELAGVVTRLGSAALSADSSLAGSVLRVGDRVICGCSDAFRTKVRCDRRTVVRVPEEITSLNAAVTLPINHVTAWLGLRARANLAAGETVLIHSAAGGTGQAAVQVAQFVGATVLATVGTEEKKAFLMRRYNIPASHIFSSRGISFKQGVQALTGGRGVDVVFNSLSGEGLVASWECIAPFGRFVEIGKKDILAHNSLPMFAFERNVSFSALDLSQINRERPDIARKALEEVLALVVQGVLRPAEPLHVFGIGELEKALRELQSGKTMGKVVVELKPDDMVDAYIRRRPSFMFDPQATYVISGGLGGLGRSVARWFVARGARHLILLSRSGTRHEQAAKTVQELERQGAHVETPSCDISDIQSLDTALKYCIDTLHMPAIKGCIQASMVIHDASFETMTFDTWQESIAPKVAGSWNLHTLLPHGMDFFVMFSSMAAVCGSPGQANYAAGNAFQGALARHRVASGERATALDLGPFFSIGYVAENAALQARFKGVSGVTEEELFAQLEYHCNPAPPDPAAVSQNCQTVVMRFNRSDAGSGDSQLAYFLQKPMFRHIAAAVDGDSERTDSGSTNDASTLAGRGDVAKALLSAPSLADAGEAMAGALCAKLATMLSLGPADIDASTPLHSYGVDSLVAVELRSWFARDVRADITIFEIMGGVTVAALGLLAAERSMCRKGW